MDFNATIDLIIKELKEAGDIIDDLKKYPGVPVLQVELAKMKCKSAGEVISILKNVNENTVSSLKEPVQEKIVPEVERPVEVRPPAQPEFVPPVTQVKKPKTAAAEAEVPPPPKTQEPKIIRKKDQETAILADQFVQPVSSLIEQLSTLQNEEEIADKLKTKPITSLTEAIGINDKFLFIREIFNGNQSEYDKALSRLESADNIADARAVIMSYTGDNLKNEAVRQLLELVKRKLPPDE